MMLELARTALQPPNIPMLDLDRRRAARTNHDQIDFVGLTVGL
nr:hypothetical protein [Sphingomonas sp. Ant H11]